jgi:hypothetical protein
MPLYSNCLNGSISASATPSMDISATAFVKLMEWSLNNGTTTASTQGLGRPSNASAQTTPTALAAEDAGNSAASRAGTAVAWGTAPLVPASYLRRVFLPGTVGAGILFTFPRGIAFSSGLLSLVVWNIAASSSSWNAAWVVDD